MLPKQEPLLQIAKNNIADTLARIRRYMPSTLYDSRLYPVCMYIFTPETSMSVVHFQFLQFFLFCVIHIGITPILLLVVVLFVVSVLLLRPLLLLLLLSLAVGSLRQSSIKVLGAQSIIKVFRPLVLIRNITYVYICILNLFAFCFDSVSIVLWP